jgi:hypothetical protein
VFGRGMGLLAAVRAALIVAAGSAADAPLFSKTVFFRKPQTITGVRFHGERKVRVNLAAGNWTFFSKTGQATSLVVTPDE